MLAETFRQREQQLAFPEGLEPQKQVLLQRAELLLEAQREYFNTISLNNLDNYYWAAASGYRIGHMYDELWQAVMSAPVPAHLPPEGHAIYRDELAKLIKPLIRHAIRYWELTEMFIERTGMQTPWAVNIKSRPRARARAAARAAARAGRLRRRPRPTRTRRRRPGARRPAARGPARPLTPPSRTPIRDSGRA